MHQRAVKSSLARLRLFEAARAAVSYQVASERDNLRRLLRPRRRAS